jgi:sialic acid synthase SpsE
MKIGNIDTDREILLIAEVGNNHEGDFELACRMISQAAESGAHAVKFQTIRPEQLVASDNPARMERLKGFEFSDEQFEKLAGVAKDEGIIFLSTPFALNVVGVLDKFSPAFKIASGDIDFFPLIGKVCETGKPLILSCGCSDPETVQTTVDFIASRMDIKDKLALLHCVVSYPTPADQANLRTIAYLKHKFDLTVGYSDHTIGTEAVLAAGAMGARIIEKHFTVDKNYSDFHDHQLSADPADMKKISAGLKLINEMLGEYGKPVMACEKDMKDVVRRSVASLSPLPAGHVVGKEDLNWIRPATGYRPGEEDRVIGKTLKKAMNGSELFQPDNLIE